MIVGVLGAERRERRDNDFTQVDPLNKGPVLSTAGAHNRSRSRLGGVMRSDAMCSKGNNVYWPAANTSRRAPMRGSPSASEVNGVPLSVPEISR